MFIKLILVSFVSLLSVNVIKCQVLQFGECADVKTKQYFDLEKFLGEWYEIERFPTWFEQNGHCAYKRFQYCARTIEIEHIYVTEGVQFVLHINSSYAPGDEAVFAIPESNIDPVGIPLSVISTDYTNYAVMYGCRTNDELDIKYILAWILSRNPNLSEEILNKARRELNAVPYANLGYLEPVDHSNKNCGHHWTAHVNAENITEADRREMLYSNDIYGYTPI